MKLKDMAALGAASGILIQAWAIPVSAAYAAVPEVDHRPTMQLIVELAGADDPDKASPEQLKKAGQDMVPAEGMKKAEPKSVPSQPMKFCCASIRETVTGVVPVFLSVNWKTATGMQELFESPGIAGDIASIETCTGRPGIS